MKLRRKAFLAIIPFCLCLCLTACGGGEASEAESNEASTADKPASEKSKTPAEMGDIHVTIESVEVSAAALKAQDHTVPVRISLDCNSGINYSEWGAQVDTRCTFTVDSIDAESLILSEYYSINEEKKFVWNAWASGQDFKKTGDILILHVKLPADAAAGDSYPITYADWSLGDSPHKWTSTSTNWVSDDAVTWTDGGITVTE